MIGETSSTSERRLFLVIPDTVLAALLLENLSERAYRENDLAKASDFHFLAFGVRQAFNKRG